MGDEACRLVTTNNVEVFRLLGAPAVGRLGLDFTVARDLPQLLALVKQLQPKVTLVDTELAGGSGFEACAQLKGDPDTAKTHVVLVLDPRLTGGRLSKSLLDRVAASGADDILALPIHPDDFYYHLAHLTGLPFRRDRRIGVDLEIQLPTPGGTTRGTVVNVGAGGVGVRVPSPLPVGERLAVRFFEPGGQQSPDTRVLIAWNRATHAHDGDGDGDFSAGLRFDGEPPVKTRLLLEQVALFEATIEGTTAAVTLHGDFTEMTRFDALSARLAGATDVELDLASVRYLSSAGVREWCQFLAGLTRPGVTYRFRHCSIAFATQAAMVPLVLGEGEVVSLEAPYFCEACDREDLRLLEPGVVARDGDRLVPPRLLCATCGAELVFDDVPERYFAFLKDD